MHIRGSRTALVALALFAGAAAVAAEACATGAPPAQMQGGDASTDDGSMQHDSSSGGGKCDANTQSDFTNCGFCGHVCPTGQICNAGKCQDSCAAPESVCPGLPGCFNLTNDLQNCGGCGTQCYPPTGGGVPGTAQCVSSFCDFTCPATSGGATDAGPSDAGATDAAASDAGAPVAITKCPADGGTPGCFDLTSATQNCGSCGNACATGDICASGMCCPTGSAICGGACTNVQTSQDNCGACEAGCPMPAQCIAGKCSGYVTSNPTEPFIDACSLPGHQAVLPNEDYWTAAHGTVTLPFSFTFFGVAQTQVWLQNQGAIGFGTPATGAFAPDNYPDCIIQGDPTTRYAAAVVFGDENLATGNNGVCYGTTGGGDGGTDAGSPNQFVVTWSQTTENLDLGSVLTFSLVLTEGTNTLDFQYLTAADGEDGGLHPAVAGANATVGIQSPQGSVLAYAAYSCGTTFIPSLPFNVRFTPAQ